MLVAVLVSGLFKVMIIEVSMSRIVKVFLLYTFGECIDTKEILESQVLQKKFGSLKSWLLV